MISFLFDFHVHFSFKPANSANFTSGTEPDPDHWRERLGMDHFSLASLGEKTVIKSSQINGNACTLGLHRVLCNGLYPLERGFIRNSIINSISTLTGFSLKSLRDLESCRSSYFAALEQEYHNLLAHQNDPTFSKHGNVYMLVNSFQEIMQNINTDTNILNILNSVEGGHAFAGDIRDANGIVVDIMAAEKRHIKSLFNGGAGDIDFKQYITLLAQNIDHVKSQWAHIPFFVGLSHHYYNHLAGHSPSLTTVVNTALSQYGSTVDQNDTTKTIDVFWLGIHPWGQGILNKLLSRITANGSPTRRVLIDIKHMSPQARLDYYGILDRMIQNNPGERVPIIVSHTAVSGRRDTRRSIDNDYVMFDDEKDNCRFFYSGFGETLTHRFEGIINLFDDEIVRIVNSDGLIGLMIDERRIMGRFLPPESGFDKKSEFNKIAKKSGKALNAIVKCNHRITRLLKDLSSDPTNAEIQQKIQDLQREREAQERIRDDNLHLLKASYLSVIMRQIFHILDLTGEKGWDHLCLGTDYDGVINPIDIYAQCSDMLTIFDDITLFWEDMMDHDDPDIRNLYRRHLHGKTTEFWIHKLLLLNGMNFLKKYFNDGYLRNGINPQTGWVLTNAEETTLSFNGA
ncbi:MAG TPA: hypothetical protein VI603_08450 [Saprospiraceae bacterium]|nr:hypothetical protein [Saprospiraceae bacterium]